MSVGKQLRMVKERRIKLKLKQNVLVSGLGFIDVIKVFDRAPITIVSGGQEVEYWVYQI